MQIFDLPVTRNPLKTRADVETALLQMLEPLLPRFSEGGALPHFGNTAAHYCERSARMEGFSRLLWGLGPLWTHSDETRFLDIIRRGLINGTDPQSPEYWGEVHDFDQKMVEMAAISLALCLAPEKLWEPLTNAQKDNLFNFMNAINRFDMPSNNWLFFRVLVNTMFRLRGLPYDTAMLESDLERIDGYYIADGWYFDGQPTQIDYYIPFGMHYYGLVYSVLAKDLDPARAEKFRGRAKLFAPDFLLWFGKEGDAVPFGRSLTYRFAQASFFSALAFAGEEALPWGVIKAHVLGNLRWWMKRPVFTPDGILSIGYAYPNLFMTETYNAPGSPYWAFKLFLCLALDEDHPFWRAEEAAMELPAQKLLPHAGIIAARDDASGQAVLFPAGRKCAFLGSHTEKYEKLAYSNLFGFSMARGSNLEEGAFDCVLAVSESGENHYRMRDGFECAEATEDYTRVRYSPMRGVLVETWVVPMLPWHVRVHRITAHKSIDVADGAFAIASERDMAGCEPDEIIEDGDGITAAFKWGISGIIRAHGPGSPVLVKAQPNTNLLEPLTVIPTWTARLEKGEHLLVTMVVGDAAGCVDKAIKEKPEVSKDGGKITVCSKNGRAVTIAL